MKNGDYNFKKGPLLPGIGGASQGYNGAAGGPHSSPQPIVVGPKRALELSAANEEDFWYGEKKDKRLGIFYKLT